MRTLLVISVFILVGIFTLMKPNQFIECWKRGGVMGYGMTGWYKGMRCSVSEKQLEQPGDR